MSALDVLLRAGRRTALVVTASGLMLAPAADAQLRGATGVTYPSENIVVPALTTGLGDVNADGFGDLSGFTRLPTQDEPGMPDSFTLFGARVQTNIDLTAVSPRLKLFPTTVFRPAGDVNGDGRDDVLVAVGGPPSGTPTVYVAVVFGGPGVENVRLDRLGSRGFQIRGEDGWVPVGDVTGDGRADLATITRDSSVYESDIEGVTVLFGKATSSAVDPANPGSGGVRLTSSVGEPTPEGSSIAAGDLNGDGRGDIALMTGTRRGTAIFGAANFGTVDLDAPGTRGYRIDELNGLQSETLDFTGDRRADLIAFTGDNPYTLNSSIVPGQASSAPVSALPDGVGPAIGIPARNLVQDSAFAPVAPVGDVNRDGRQDVVGAAPFTGQVFLYYGRAGRGQAPAGPQIPGVFANVLRPAGDVDGDGAPDVLASQLSFSESTAGRPRDRNTLLTRGRDILPPSWVGELPAIVPTAFRPGDSTDIRATVSEPSTVELVVRRANGSLVGTVRFPMTIASQAADWDGRVNGKALPPGDYRTTVTLTDAVGLRSTPAVVPFTILP